MNIYIYISIWIYIYISIWIYIYISIWIYIYILVYEYIYIYTYTYTYIYNYIHIDVVVHFSLDSLDFESLRSLLRHTLQEEQPLKGFLLESWWEPSAAANLFHSKANPWFQNTSEYGIWWMTFNDPRSNGCSHIMIVNNPRSKQFCCCSIKLNTADLSKKFHKWTVHAAHAADGVDESCTSLAFATSGVLKGTRINLKVGWH